LLSKIVTVFRFPKTPLLNLPWTKRFRWWHPCRIRLSDSRTCTTTTIE